MKLQLQLPYTSYPVNIFLFLAVIILTGTFLSVLVEGTDMRCLTSALEGTEQLTDKTDGLNLPEIIKLEK